MKEQRIFEIKHKNGYSAKLYGKSSMIVYCNGKEVSHTGSRNVNTREEVMKLLETYPKFIKIIQAI